LIKRKEAKEKLIFKKKKQKPTKTHDNITIMFT